VWALKRKNGLARNRPFQSTNKRERRTGSAGKERAETSCAEEKGKAKQP